MPSYAIFDGVMMVCDDRHVLPLPIDAPCGVLEMEYCHEGRMEFENQTLRKGDVRIVFRVGECDEPCSVSRDFRGMYLTMDLGRAHDGMRPMLHDLKIDLHALKEKYCGGGRTTCFHGNASLISIFAAMYDAPEKFRCNYAKTRLPELIFFLDACQTEEFFHDRSRNFSRYAIAQTRAARQYLMESTTRPITIAELSKKCCISQTVLKECFKWMYGENIAAFSRRIRMESAAELLRETDLNVLDVALQVGYVNASKFAKAFHAFFGCNPKEYRRKMG